jgi:hypothetical protein
MRSSRPDNGAGLAPDVVVGRIAERPGIGSTGLVAGYEPADVRDQPVGVMDGGDRAVRLDGDVVPGRDDLAGQALLFVPRGRDVGVGAVEHREGLPCPVAAGLDLAPLLVSARKMPAQRAVRAIVGVEQHRQDRRSEPAGPVRHQGGRHDGAQLGKQGRWILDLELPMRLLVHAGTVPFCSRAGVDMLRTWLTTRSAGQATEGASAALSRPASSVGVDHWHPATQ